MKYLCSFLFFVAVLILACGEKKSSDQNQASSEKKETKDLSNNPVYEKGLRLIAQNDCTTCHKVGEKVIGPSYRDIANKYTQEDIEYLTKKIASGGSGVWGEVPMAAHPNLSKEDLVAIVNYILLLREK